MKKHSFDPEEALEAALRGDSICGEFAMRIDADGVWYHDRRPIERPELVRLFATALRRASDGSHWLLTPVEQGRIGVEETPFTAVALGVRDAGRRQRLSIRRNIGDWRPIEARQPIAMRTRSPGAEEAPYHIDERGLESRLLRSVFYDLVGLAEPADDDPSVLGVWSNDCFFRLGRRDGDEDG